MHGLGASDIWSALQAVAGSRLAATLAAFALILVLGRLKAPLWLAIPVGVLALGAMVRKGPGEIALTLGLGAVNPLTLGVVAATSILLAISETMSRSGQMSRIVGLAQGLFRRPAVAMAALPALIGLLPMPGGAVFSAPMVHAAAGKTPLRPEEMSGVNYWYRHIWEHWWPMYPGVILALTLTRSDLGPFILHQFPLGVLMAAAGLLVFRGMHPDLHRRDDGASGSGDAGGAGGDEGDGRAGRAGVARDLLAATSTIWIILAVWPLASWALSAVTRQAPDESAAGIIRRFAPLTAGLVISLLWTIRMNRFGLRQVRGVVLNRSILKMAVLVISVMMFQHALKRWDLAPRIADELRSLRMPPEVVVALLPLIAGLVTGLAVGFVGTSFPIVLAAVAAMPDHGSIRPYVALAYAFGHVGQMLSPLHICQILSNEYFHAPFRATYRRILPSAIVTAALAVAYFVVLKLITAGRA